MANTASSPVAHAIVKKTPVVFQALLRRKEKSKSLLRRHRRANPVSIGVEGSDYFVP